ncbi:uncharacterized protein PV09_05735 [Verruconis gallopava]|uniref:Uncharacterized protein n=1 Tax=Verruconis gallopava TaxID=253628 RepID=A0A0D2A964_9PEZI|nr:uncharacterized protein PV09_05735 [Verruconis gallopava]KIW03090.1 hypothetical protein PV09_05735 [Verruconis gallopava]
MEIGQRMTNKEPSITIKQLWSLQRDNGSADTSHFEGWLGAAWTKRKAIVRIHGPERGKQVLSRTFRDKHSSIYQRDVSDMMQVCVVVILLPWRMPSLRCIRRPPEDHQK